MEEICLWNTRAPILSAEEMEMLETSGTLLEKWRR